MAKNKKSSLAEILADSQPITEQVEIGDHSVTIQEMSGRDRFSLGEREDDDRWETLLWICLVSMIDPKPESIDVVEEMRADWVVKIATAAMRLSGIEEDAAEEAENESANVSAIGGS